MCAIIEKIQKEVPIMSTNENKDKKAEVTALQQLQPFLYRYVDAVTR